jgi:hypothetical protein
MSPSIVAAVPIKPPQVEAVVVAYNGMDCIGACLQSLLDQDHTALSITVIDNASSDGTAAYVRDCFPSVKLIEAGENLGFAAGNNLAFARSTAEWILLLNQDAAAARDCVRELVRVGNGDPAIGAVGAKMLMARCPSIFNSTGIAMNLGGWAWDRQIGEKDRRTTREPEAVFGACGGALLLRRSALQQVGPFDPVYFMYFEDVDLCWRLRLCGYSILHVPAAVVTHEYHGDRGTPERALRRRYLCERNRLQTVLKNVEWGRLRTMLPQIWRYDRARLAQHGKAILRGENRDLNQKVCGVIRRAWWWNVLHLPSILWRRRAVQKLRRVADAAFAHLVSPGTDEPSHVGDLDLLYDSQSATPVRAIVMGRSDQGTLGPGWHGLEGDPQGTQTRWCKGEAFFYLQAEAGDAQLVVRLSCPPALGQVTLRAGEVELGRVDVHGGVREMAVPLPLELPRGVVQEFVLRTTTFRPVDRGMGLDVRTLGVVVFGMRLSA